MVNMRTYQPNQQTAEVSVRCETVSNSPGRKAWPGRSTWSRYSFGGVPWRENKGLNALVGRVI